MNLKEKNYAFIFARGGSKGLPKKNIKLLAGMPLINYSIEAALKTNHINKVFVSTDDDEIADISVKAGAILIKRPDYLASDNSPEWLSWQHAVNFVHNKYGSFDKFVSLPPTSPLRSLQDIKAAIKKHNSSAADTCITITPSSRSPYFNMVEINNEGFARVANKNKYIISRRQDAPEIFDITTVAYVSTPSFIINNDGIFSGSVSTVIVPKERAVDIDDIFDFKFAESILLETMTQQENNEE